MSNTISQSASDRRNRRHVLLGIVLGCCALLVLVSAVAAYFSAYINKSSQITTATLALNGTYEFFVNDDQTAVSEIVALAPGDIITISGQVSNTGNLRAWIRDIISFDNADAALLPYLRIYVGTLTREQLTGTGDISEFALALDQGAAAVSTNKIIDGVGTGAENTPQVGDEFLNSPTYQMSYTIYFDHTADNTTQNKQFGMTFATQAVQYRNNPAPENSWASIVTNP